MKKKGLTMIELIVVMVLLSILLPVLLSIYVYGTKTFNEELSQSELQSDAQTILDSILNDIRNAQSVEASYDDQFFSNGTTIVLKVPALDQSQNIIYDGSTMQSDIIVYSFYDNSIHKRVFADADSRRATQNNIDKILASNILELNFTYEPDPLAATLVQVTLKNHKKVGNQSKSINVSSKARLRNHI